MRDILVVEDHPLVAEATKSLLSTMPVGHIEVCTSSEAAVARLNERPDWFRIFLDVGVPGACDLSLIRHVHDRGFAQRSAVITASENQEWRNEVKKLGFLGYILKTASVNDFSFALNEILEGKFHFTQKQCDDQTLHLTRKQTEILSMLRDGVQPHEMARMLNISFGTISNHINSILHALRASDTNEAVSIGIRMGHIVAKHYE